MQHIQTLLYNVKESLAIVIGLILAFLMPIAPLLITVGVFIFADTITGIWKAKKTGDKITSRKLSVIVSKMVLYQSAIILFFLLEKYIIGDMVAFFVSIPWFLTKLVACTLCSIEVKSIDENYTAITGVSMWDRFKKLLARAKEVKDDIKEVTK